MVLDRDTVDGRRAPLTIVAGLREDVGLWMLQQLPDVLDLPGGYEAIGVARGDRLVGGCLFSDFKPWPGGGDIQIWAAGHGWLSRRIIKAMLGYPFGQLGCHRVTAITAKKNRRARRLLEALGFRLEGVARQGLGLRKDACIYAMQREECRWLD